MSPYCCLLLVASNAYFVGNFVGNFVDEAPDNVPDKVSGPCGCLGLSRRQRGNGAEPRMRGAAPRTVVQALATNRTKPHTRTRAPQRPLARGAYMDRVERPEWPACTTVRGDRRAATALRRTTNEAFSARYLAGVRSAPRWRQAQALSPRAIRARAPSGLCGDCSAQEKVEDEACKMCGCLWGMR